MKHTVQSTAVLASLLRAASATGNFSLSDFRANAESTFSVLRFHHMLTEGRMDPIVSPGEPSQHVHGILGGSGFHMGATGEDLMNSQCTTATVQGDNSAYWFPTLYFQDPGTEELEPVPFYYASVYYLYVPLSLVLQLGKIIVERHLLLTCFKL